MSACPASSFDPFWLMMAGALIIVAVAALPATDASDPQPAPAPGVGIAYAPYVFADHDTGCQYLSTHNSAGLAPRIAADGKTHMGCKRSTQ